MIIGAIGIYLVIHVAISTQYGIFRTPMPSWLAGMIKIQCEEFNRQSRLPARMKRYFCDCWSGEFRKKYYFEEYILISLQFRYDRIQGGNGDPNKFDGGRTNQIKEICYADFQQKFE
jgi:hypothetical protein